jgi:thymidylate kinase
MNIRPVGAELFHADRHNKANSRISQFCERAQKVVADKFVSSLPFDVD